MTGKKAGKIKSGLGTLIGNSGEHYVMAELLKRDVVAALAPRNAPGFDIIATKDSRTVRIRVKTKSEEYDSWQWNAKKDGTVFKAPLGQDDFTVLVHLALETPAMRFFIAPTKDIEGWLRSDFEEWLRTPGAKGQQRSETNKRRLLVMSKYEGKLSTDWETFWK